jgi:hypothetical protein
VHSASHYSTLCLLCLHKPLPGNRFQQCPLLTSLPVGHTLTTDCLNCELSTHASLAITVFSVAIIGSQLQLTTNSRWQWQLTVSFDLWLRSGSPTHSHTAQPLHRQLRLAQFLYCCITCWLPQRLLYQPLSNNSHLLQLPYSGFQSSCHGIRLSHQYTMILLKMTIINSHVSSQGFWQW